jgi:hypothetical protein
MRAQMIWEAYEYYRPSERRTWINLALVALTQVKEQTINLMVSLYKTNGNVKALGFGSVATYERIFDTIGWWSFLDILDRKYTLPTTIGGVGIFDLKSPAVSSSSGIITSMPVTPEDTEHATALLKSDYLGIIQHVVPSVDSVNSMRSLSPVGTTTYTTAPSSQDYVRLNGSGSGTSGVDHVTNPPSSSGQGVSSSSSHTYRNVTIDATWDITDHLMIVRFLTLCRLLSVGKRAKVQAGIPNAVVRARTDPEFIYDQAEREIESFYNSGHREVGWKKLISEDRAGRSFLVKEEEAVQVWLSGLTANWSVNLAKEIGLSQSMSRYLIFLCVDAFHCHHYLNRFLNNTILINARRISCVASHPSIVPIRAEWLLRGTPILMLIRRICSQGE